MAGPILRPSNFMAQLASYKGLDFRPVHVLLFTKGLFKKLIIADNLSLFADSVLNNPESYPSLVVWTGVLCFTVQI